MAFKLTSEDYLNYLKLVAEKINENKDYITSLDSAIGDGDHWTNMNKGFQAILGLEDKLKELTISEMFNSIGMKLMGTVGGSAGLLYGTAYLAAAKLSKDIDYLDIDSIYLTLEGMANEIMERGRAKVGEKTMVDSITPAVQAFRKALDEKVSIIELCDAVKDSAKNGAQSTIDMPATKGRAYYQENKGVGHLDPGAITMSYQIEILMDFIKALEDE